MPNGYVIIFKEYRSKRSVRVRHGCFRGSLVHKEAIGKRSAHLDPIFGRMSEVAKF